MGKFWGGVGTQDQSAGVYWSDLQFKFMNPGKLTVAAKGTGKIQTQATKATNSYEANSVFLPWQAVFTLAGAGNTKIFDASINLSRPVEWIWGFSGTQDGTGGNVGPLRIKGTFTAASTDLTELNYYLNNTQPVASIVFTSGTNTLTFQMSKTAFVDPTELDHGNPYARTTMNFDAVANSTDAGTGNAPIKVILVNTRNTAY
jgi:Phage tail tube protein